MRTWILSASALILLMLGMRALLKGRLSLRLRYALWLPVLLRLLIPGSFWTVPQFTRPVAADLAVIGDPVQRREYAIPETREQASLFVLSQEDRLQQATPHTAASVSLPETDAPDPEPAAPMAARSHGAPAIAWPDLLPWIWGAGAAAVLGAALGSELRFSLRLRRSRQRLEDTETRLPVYSCPWLKTPCLAGILRPAVYLPAALREDESALRHALAHEQAHLRHGDLLWSRLRCLALALHWYNPLVWLAALLSKRDGELACDEGAIIRLGDAQRAAYGRTLIQLSCPELLGILRPVPGMASGGKTLRERVRLIASGPNPTAWALVLALSVSLLATGCSFSEKKPEQMGPFYESEYHSLNMGGKNAITLLFTGERFYSVVTEEGESGAFESRLYSSSADGSDRREILIRSPILPEIPEDAEVQSFTLDQLLPGADGSILALGGTFYRIPVGQEYLNEDGTTEFEYNWHTAFFALSISAEGEVLSQFPIIGQWGPVRPQTDGQGNLYLIDESGELHVYDTSGREILNLHPAQYWEQLVRLIDGRAAAVFLNGGASEVHAIDPKDGKLELIARIPDQLGITVFPGAFGWDVLVNNGTMLYGVNAAGERGTIATWLNCDLNGNELLDIIPEENGEAIRCVFGTPYVDDGDFGFATIRQTDDPPREDRTVLTLACMGLDDEIAGLVLHFNRTERDYRIEVKDYSGYNTAASPSAGYTLLNAEIVAGNVPDLFCIQDLPVRTYGAHGLLEDLWPYIDADQELGGRDALVTPLFSAMEQKGKLYTVAPSFSIYTVIGPKATVGDRSGWTMEEFREAWNKMPEDCTIMEPWFGRESALTTSLVTRVDQFVDWTTGICRFDSEEFRDLIRFADLFPEQGESAAYYGGSEYERITGGEQMLLFTALSSFDDVTFHTDFLGDQAVYVGLPGASGNGSAFDVPSGLAMSASCRYKEAAWRFLRRMLDADWQLSNAGKGGASFQFPAFLTNRRALEQGFREAMRVEYKKDEKGQYLLDVNGEKIEQARGGRSIGLDGKIVPVYAMTQEQADRLLELIEGTTCMRYWDDVVMDVVFDEIGDYYSEEKTLEQVTAGIQKRMTIYMEEQK